MFVYEESWGKTHCKDPGVTWEEFLQQVGLGTPKTYEEAKEFFEKALAPSNASVDYFSTLSQLRESPIRDEVDLEFCFSHLPLTEKNGFLKKLTLLYLKSPLAQTDRLARTTQLAECLELPQHPVLTAPALTLVKARQSSPLFHELYRTLAALRPDKTTRLIETWETSGCDSKRLRAPLVLRHLSPYVLIDRLVKTLEIETKRKRAARLFFEGTLTSRAYLVSAAAASGIRLEVFDSPLEREPEALRRLRQSGLPLAERLRLSRVFVETKHCPDFKQWVAEQNLASDYKALLLNMPHQSPPPEPASRAVLLPFHPLPATRGTTDLYFLEPVPEPQKTLAFDPSERFRLFTQGFILQDADPLKDRKGDRLGALQRAYGQRPKVFLAAEFPWKSKSRGLRAKTELPKPKGKEAVALPLPLTLTATALETFAACPAKYFFSQALRFRKKLPEEQGFALYFGKLVHRALEWAFQENPWDSVDEALLIRMFERALSEAEAPAAAWFRVSLRQRFLPLAASVAKMERKLREALGPLTPCRFEQSFEFELLGATFKGRIDRMDRSESGTFHILDYKTGTVDFSPEHIKKGHHFQALLYLLSQTEPLGGIVFYDLKAGEVRRGVLRDREGIKQFFTRGHVLTAEGWDSLLDLGKQHLATIVSRIKAGEFDPTPSTQACERCDMGLFCHQQNGVSG